MQSTTEPSTPNGALRISSTNLQSDMNPSRSKKSATSRKSSSSPIKASSRSSKCKQKKAVHWAPETRDNHSKTSQGHQARCNAINLAWEKSEVMSSAADHFRHRERATPLSWIPEEIKASPFHAGEINSSGKSKVPPRAPEVPGHCSERTKPPPAPRPRRLSSPDLPEIDCGSFCYCCGPIMAPTDIDIREAVKWQFDESLTKMRSQVAAAQTHMRNNRQGDHSNMVQGKESVRRVW